MATKLKDIPFETLVPTIVPTDKVPVRDETFCYGESRVAVVGAREMQMLDLQGNYVSVITPSPYSCDGWFFNGIASVADIAGFADCAGQAGCADYAIFADCAEFAYCAGCAGCADYAIFADCAGRADCAYCADHAFRLGCLSDFCDSASIYAECGGLYFEYKGPNTTFVSKLLQYGEVGSLPAEAKVLYFT